MADLRFGITTNQECTGVINPIGEPDTTTTTLTVGYSQVDYTGTADVDTFVIALRGDEVEDDELQVEVLRPEVVVPPYTEPQLTTIGTNTGTPQKGEFGRSFNVEGTAATEFLLEVGNVYLFEVINVTRSTDKCKIGFFDKTDIELGDINNFENWLAFRPNSYGTTGNSIADQVDGGNYASTLSEESFFMEVDLEGTTYTSATVKVYSEAGALISSREDILPLVNYRVAMTNQVTSCGGEFIFAESRFTTTAPSGVNPDWKQVGAS